MADDWVGPDPDDPAFQKFLSGANSRPTPQQAEEATAARAHVYAQEHRDGGKRRR